MALCMRVGAVGRGIGGAVLIGSTVRGGLIRS